MCKSKAQGGVRCLSHMSQQISPQFGEAYKELTLSKNGVLEAGGATTALNNAEQKCRNALNEANMTAEARKAANVAVSATIADYLISAEKRHLAESNQPLSEDFATKREALREARSVAQKNLHSLLPKPADSEKQTVAAQKAAIKVKMGSLKKPVTVGASPSLAGQKATWNLPDSYANVQGLASFDGVSIKPGVVHKFALDENRAVTIKDRRSSAAGELVMNEETLRQVFDTVEAGPGKYEIRINDEPGIYGSHRIKSDGTHQINLNVKTKDSYPVGSGYVINNSLVHELRHAHQAQNTPNFHEEYANETATKGYEKNKFEVEAWSYGRLADHTGEKTDLPANMTAMAGKVWAFLPSSTQ